MPMWSRGCESKSMPSDSTASNANWLARSSRRKRVPSRATRTSASVTRLAAEMNILSTTKNERAVDAAKTGVELQNVIKPRHGARLTQETGRSAFRRHGQPRCAGQQSLLHRQDAQNGLDHSGRAEGVAQHSFRAAHGWTSPGKHGVQGQGFHRIVVRR